MSNEQALLGDEAVALAAIHAGLSAAYGYPGTPSTEILEYLIAQYEAGGPVARWCANEKTAMEAALGVSFAGRRSIVTMKHVGLNVASDPFINAALLGIKGGLVVAVADDPGMHSSQNEQDSRFYAAFALVPCLEPRSQQEAYDMTREAFDVSERFQVPVLLRLATRLSHARAAVKTQEPIGQKPVSKTTEKSRWMLLPAFARKNYAALVEKQAQLQAWSQAHSANKLELPGVGGAVSGAKNDLAIITSGLGGNYYEENLADLTALRAQRGGKAPPRLHIGAYPLPLESIRRLCAAAEKVLVIEEGQPFIEEKLRGLLPQNAQSVEILGRLDREFPANLSRRHKVHKEHRENPFSSLRAFVSSVRGKWGKLPEKTSDTMCLCERNMGAIPRTGELDPDNVRAALGLEPRQSVKVSANSAQAGGLVLAALPGRPPQLCAGCPHADSYETIKKAVEAIDPRPGHPDVGINSDIGCYSLGASPPYQVPESIVCMGASVGMAKGAADAGLKYSLAVIGDSTFIHSGITGLIDAAANDIPMTLIILDNSIVAMTGCQETMVASENLAKLVLGCGVRPEHLLELEAKKQSIEENTHKLKAEIEYRGLSVVIFKRECLEAFRKRRKSK